MAKRNEVTPAAERPVPTLANVTAVFDKLVERGAKEVGSDRTKLRLYQPGDYVFAFFAETHTGKGERKDFPVYYLDTPDGEHYFMLGGGNLSQKIHGDHVGHVLGILYTGDKDVDKPQPMREFRVIDCGSQWPAGINADNAMHVSEPTGGEPAEDEIPF